MPGRYSLELANFESHPIAKDLGLKPDAIASMIGAYIDVDFVLECGSVVWEAQSAR